MTNAVETNRILGSPPNWCVIPPCLPNLLWKLFLPICIESARLDTTMTLAQSEPKNLVYKIAPEALFCRRRHQPRRPEFFYRSQFHSTVSNLCRLQPGAVHNNRT